MKALAQAALQPLAHEQHDVAKASGKLFAKLEALHTPGPWFFVPETPHAYTSIRSSVGPVCWWERDVSCPIAYDGNLMAAAPDLLAALENLVNSPGLNADDLHSTEQAIKEARAAIAKAKGGAK